MNSTPAAVEDSAQGQGEPLVTVVIPARNEQAAIGPCLDSVLAQDWTNLQVIVVDGDSDDDTAAIVASYTARDPRVELLPNPQRVIPVGLNLALAEAKGEWLVRIDAHAAVPPDYVRRAAEHLMTGRYGGVGGRKDGVGRTPAGKAIAAVMASRFGVGGSTYHHGTTVAEVEHVPFGAYPVAVARALGGWDEQLRVNQDFEFDHRVREAGHTILFDPALRIDWESRQSISDFAKQYHRYGGGKVNVAIKHPESLKPRHLAAPALVLQVAVALAALVSGRPGRAAVVISPYAVALAAGYATTAPGLEPGARRFVVPAFLAMHLGWGIGFWRQAGRRAAAALSRR
ncbi:glycosyltransferase family 2 protein [Blastococcus tunisiensis]|uniref:Glycosyl transferase family 2 n=1 Tax=Blastococcus tunisiensis TaxID=1798228 RepID=A0A1I1X9F4_9ACTN|nr:glycosyltransferase family 2 protein [Blastococcus sp. DSM 46838]SFE04056.1 Glycosyl transferase family 2 [Blastococcus sp. DSM 46838]